MAGRAASERARRSRTAIAVLGGLGCVLLLAAASPREVSAGTSLVRLDGVLGVENAPGNIVQATLAIGAKSIPFSVLAAQRISGEPFEGPGVLLALGPGPPPIRVEGRPETVEKLLDAPKGARAVITGTLGLGMATLTLMSAEITPSAASQ